MNRGGGLQCSTVQGPAFKEEPRVRLGQTRIDMVRLRLTGSEQLTFSHSTGIRSVLLRFHFTELQLA